MRRIIVWATLFSLSLFVACGDSGGELVDGDVDDTEQGIEGGLVINEIVAKSSTDEDWIELYNQSNEDLDISNYQLMDSKDTEEYIIPAGTMISSNSYLVFDRDKSGETGFAFGLSAEDAVRLLDADANLVDSTNWLEGEAPEDRSWGRSPNGSGGFKTLLSASKGKENLYSCGDSHIDDGEECDDDNLNDTSCVSLGFKSGALSCNDNCSFDFSQCVYASNEVSINEVVVKATDEEGESLPDWIELYNPGGRTNLSGWIIKDSSDTNMYSIEENTFIESGEYLVFEYDKSEIAGFDFGLGSADSVRIYNRQEELLGETSWIEDQVPDGTSWGRIPDGTGSFMVLENITKAGANVK